MASGGGALDPQGFIRIARTIALEVAQENGIFLHPNALEAVDTIVREHMPRVERRFRDNDLDYAGYERLVRMAALRAAKEFRANRIRTLDDPDELIRTVRPLLLVYPFDC